MTGRLLGEGVGTALLLFVIVGSGIAAETSTSDQGLQLLAHALAVGLGLAVLIALFQTVSGSHFNPAVTLAFWRTGDVSGAVTLRYIAAQVGGAILGVAAADLTYGNQAFVMSANERSGVGLVAAEAVATFVLVIVILALVRTGRAAAVPAAVGAWVSAAIFATASTSFANPAVTVGRMFTDTYTGIHPSSVGGFVVAQVVAGFAAAALAPTLFPRPGSRPVPD